MKTDPNELSWRWVKILQRVAIGEDCAAAARAEGCSASYSLVLPARMKKHPAAQKFLDEIRAKGVELTAFTVAKAHQQAADDREFARRNGNSMAAHKSTELQSKLAGHLVERQEIVTVSMRPALEAAQHRVFARCHRCRAALRLEELLCAQCQCLQIEATASLPSDPPAVNGDGSSSP